MSEITLLIPDESALALKLTPEALAAELRLAAAVKFLEVGRLSTGAAAILAGIPVPLFLAKLVGYNALSFRVGKEELEEDLASS